MDLYDNLGVVGEGSYGTVMKCRHKENGHIVAIKKFIDKESDKNIQKIITREVKLLRVRREAQERETKLKQVAFSVPQFDGGKLHSAVIHARTQAISKHGTEGICVCTHLCVYMCVCIITTPPPPSWFLNSVCVLTQQFHHENLVNMLEVFHFRKRLYLVFEYMDRTVLEELERNPWGLEHHKLRKHIFQILRAVEYLHSNSASIVIR